METASTAAPSVVSVMVVHEPGDWFDETLRGLAAQDYPNLRTLFLITPNSDEASVRAAIAGHLPNAFVRMLPDNSSFGGSVNSVLRLVEGDNGFFMVCHDDIVLAHDAVRLMVEELFRSNAGIVGPKLVEWDHPRVLQHVGIGLDRLGEVDPIIDPGETDQEQHDAVRDVFVIPSACMLVRADLFRVLGGFDPAISFYGEDVELCWRTHLTGARVVVVPDARVRHLERLHQRRPDLNDNMLRSRHRMRTVATLTAGSRLLARSFQMLFATLAELVVGVFTGRVGEAFSSLWALVGLVPRTPALLARRRAIKPIRKVPDDDIIALQVRGSARLATYLRGRETATYVHDGETVRRWRQATLGPLLMWSLALLAIIVGGRKFIQGAVPTVGEFLPLPESPRAVWSTFVNAFNFRSFGATSPNPTGYASLAVASVGTLFHNGLLFTVLVLGLPLVGALGLWRLASVFPSERSRISATVVYLATPLVPHLLGAGDFTALVVYGALPWLVYLSTRVAGIRTADPAMDNPHAGTEVTDAVTPIGLWERVRYLAAAVLVLAVAVSLAPVTLTIWVFAMAIIATATLVAVASWRVAAWFAGTGAVVSVGAFVLNLPWAATLGASSWLGNPNGGPTGHSLIETLSMSSPSVRFGYLGLALYVPVVAAVAIGGSWRLTWAVRGLVFVIAAGGIMVAIDRGGLSGSVPSVSVMAVPLALGLAIGAGALSSSLGLDVFQRGFGWRQPVAVLAGAALVVGLVPAVFSIGSGRFDAPTTTIVSTLESQFPESDGAADYRVLYIGTADVLPARGHPYRDGIEWAVVERGPFDFTDRFAAPSTTADAVVDEALDLIASGRSLRAGHLLAPLGIRFIVIPSSPSTTANESQAPGGLVEALSQQLDFGAAVGPPTLFIYENSAWLPVAAALGEPVASASRDATVDDLAAVDFDGATPVLPGIDRAFAVAPAGVSADVPVGVIHLGVPFDDSLRLTVAGQQLSPRVDFGLTTAFDVPAAGAAQVSSNNGGRVVLLFIIGLLWLVVFSLSAGLGARLARRTRRPIEDDTLIDLDDQEFALDEGIWESELVGSSARATGALAATSEDKRRQDRRRRTRSRSSQLDETAATGVDEDMATDDPMSLAWADEELIFADDTVAAGSDDNFDHDDQHNRHEDDDGQHVSEDER